MGMGIPVSSYDNDGFVVQTIYLPNGDKEKITNDEVKLLGLLYRLNFVGQSYTFGTLTSTGRFTI